MYFFWCHFHSWCCQHQQSSDMKNFLMSLKKRHVTTCWCLSWFCQILKCCDIWLFQLSASYDRNWSLWDWVCFHECGSWYNVHLGLRLKLKMMGVTTYSATHIHVYGDNKSDIKNTSKPNSSLNKNSSEVCFQQSTSQLQCEILMTHIPELKYLEYLMMKVLSHSKWQYLVRNLLNNFCNN